MKTPQTKLTILFLFFIYLCYSQSYKFDKIINNSFSTEFFPNQKRTNLFNSEDDSYHMQIFYRNDSLVSRIFDTKENQIHYFYLENSDSLKLFFLETKRMIKSENRNKFEFSDIKEKKETKEITLKILNDNGKKIAKYKFKIKETDKNYFSIFRISALETQLYNKIKPKIDFIVLEARGTNISGRFVKYKLDSIKDINLNVEIPN